MWPNLPFPADLVTFTEEILSEKLHFLFSESNKDVNVLFLKVNKKLHKINQCFVSNVLSLNIKKTRYTFFHKRSKKDDISFLVPKLNINNYEIKRAVSIKFLGVLFNENLTWKLHIKYTKNKISKNIDLLFKARPLFQ